MCLNSIPVQALICAFSKALIGFKSLSKRSFDKLLPTVFIYFWPVFPKES